MTPDLSKEEDGGLYMTMRIVIDQTHIDRVLIALQQQGTRYPLEELVGLCPELSWDQVSLAIDCLTRNGRVCLTLDLNRTYWVQAPRSMDGECSRALSADEPI